jgi:hypothetical protein
MLDVERPVRHVGVRCAADLELVAASCLDQVVLLNLVALTGQVRDDLMRSRSLGRRLCARWRARSDDVDRTLVLRTRQPRAGVLARPDGDGSSSAAMVAQSR